jgi:polyisoprenoid-binding protein YceI
MTRTQVAFSIVALLLVAGCAAPVATPVPAAQPNPTAPAPATAAPAVPTPTLPPTAAPAVPTAPMPATVAPAVPTAAVATGAGAPTEATNSSGTTSSDPPAQAGNLVLKLVAGSQANYRVREQLVGHSLPNDAVGTTSALTGSISIRPDGTILSDESSFIVDLRTLKSDESRRDGFIQRSTLQTSKYPTATFVPTAVEGLASPLPNSGDVTFKLKGDLTVHGVTKPVTWDVQATIAGQGLSGFASTAFKFEDFGMNPPKVPMVLGVVDNITLEVKFSLSL